MKARNQWQGIKFVVGVAALCAFVASARSAVLIDETFDTGYNRTANNIASSNMAWYKGRNNEVATVNPGSLSFSVSVNQGAEAYWGYFTDPTANFAIAGTSSSVVNGHTVLGVGDTLIASVSFYWTTVPSDTSTASIRFGLFDTSSGRSMNDLNGGASSSMFTNNPGFATFVSLMSVSTNNGISILRHTTLTTTGLFGTSGDYSQLDGSVGGNSIAQSSGENVTLQLSVYNGGSSWTLSSALYDTSTETLLEGGSVTTSDGTGLGSFSMMGFRVPRMADATAGGPYVFTDLNVSVIPEPSTLMLAVSGLAMAIMAIRRRRS